MPSVAVYCRISKDREGRAEGVETQQQRGRHYSEQHWPGQPIAVYTDNDLTAADPDVERPGYQALIAAVRRGEISQIVCAEQSRLTRQPAEWEHLTVTLARAGIGQVHCYRTGPVDVGGSKLVGRILAAVNAEEVETLRARINDRLDSLAAQGRPHGGTPYAYRHVIGPDGRKQLQAVPERAAIVVEAAERILAGWSLSAVAADLNARNAPTARGGKSWSASTVKSLLTNPTVAGYRTHRGSLTPGTWQPVLDQPTWRALQRLLTAPVVLTTDRGVYRATRSRTAPRRRYLLTGGIARCRVCGAPLIGQQRQHRDGTRVATYACHPSTGGKCCVAILAEPLEEHVADELCKELDRPGFWDAYTTDDGTRDQLLAELGEIRDRQEEVAHLYGTGQLDRGLLAVSLKPLQERQVEIEGQLGGLASGVVEISGVLLRAGWGTEPLGARRAVVVRHVESVTVDRARPGANSFDTGRVKIKFR